LHLHDLGAELAQEEPCIRRGERAGAFEDAEPSQRRQLGHGTGRNRATTKVSTRSISAARPATLSLLRRPVSDDGRRAACVLVVEGAGLVGELEGAAPRPPAPAPPPALPP